MVLVGNHVHCVGGGVGGFQSFDLVFPFTRSKTVLPIFGN